VGDERVAERMPGELGWKPPVRLLLLLASLLALAWLVGAI